MLKQIFNYIYFITHKSYYEILIEDLQNELEEAHRQLNFYLRGNL